MSDDDQDNVLYFLIEWRKYRNEFLKILDSKDSTKILIDSIFNEKKYSELNNHVKMIHELWILGVNVYMIPGDSVLALINEAIASGRLYYRKTASDLHLSLSELSAAFKAAGMPDPNDANLPPQ